MKPKPKTQEILTAESFSKIFSDNNRKVIVVAGSGCEKIASWLPIFSSARGEGVFCCCKENFKQSLYLKGGKYVSVPVIYSKKISVLEYSLFYIKNVLLVFENVSTMFKKLPSDVISRVGTNRHDKTDIIIGFENIDKVPSRIWVAADFLIVFPHDKIKSIEEYPFINEWPKKTPMLINLKCLDLIK